MTHPIWVRAGRGFICELMLGTVSHAPQDCKFELEGPRLLDGLSQSVVSGTIPFVSCAGLVTVVGTDGSRTKTNI